VLDADGHATGQPSARGSHAGLLQSVTDPQGNVTTYTYDANGNRLTMTDGTGQTSYAYDEQNRVTAVTSPGNQTVGYRYDLDGNRTKQIYPDGTAVTYTFDKADQLASLSDWATPARTTSYQYWPSGQVKTLTNVNGTTTTDSYDNAQRLTPVLNQNGASIISQHSYTLDSVGNRTVLAEALAQVGGGTTTNNFSYSYDRLYRLTGDGTRSYSYDPVGNRLSLTQGGTTSYAYDRTDRILAAGSTSYTVDADGNLTARGSDTFSYDQANRMTSATVTGTATTSVYDGDGKRVSQTTGGVTTNYVYDVNQAMDWRALHRLAAYRLRY
jgi:YD repeat-containing protein